MRRPLLALAVALLTLPLAACGSGKHSGSSGATAASVIPKSVPFLLRLDTSFDSPQWNALNTLLHKFPDGDKVLSGIGGKGIDLERDVKPAVGSETDLVALTGADADKKIFLGLTQPTDAAKFHQLLAKDSSKPVSEQIGDWQVFSDKRETIDRFKQARNGGSLGDSAHYKAAVASLPVAAIASIFVDGPALTRAVATQAKSTTGTSIGSGTGPVPGIGRIGWLAAALTAEQHGFGVDVNIQGDELTAAPYTPELPAQLPADVALLIDVKGLDSALEQATRSPALQKQLGAAQKSLGGLIDEVIGLFKNEAAFYVRPAPDGKHELTLVLSVTDESAARATLDKLATLVGAFSQKAPESQQIAGVSAQKLTLGKFSIYYAVFDGKLVVTDDEDGITSLIRGQRLATSLGWRAAADAAGLPDQTTGIFYADVPKLVPVIDALSKSGSNGKPLSDKAKQDLAPLSTAILYGSVDGDVLKLKGFAGVR